jgi:hypothetical protein
MRNVPSAAGVFIATMLVFCCHAAGQEEFVRAASDLSAARVEGADAISADAVRRWMMRSWRRWRA